MPRAGVLESIHYAPTSDAVEAKRGNYLVSVPSQGRPGLQEVEKGAGRPLDLGSVVHPPMARPTRTVRNYNQ